MGAWDSPGFQNLGRRAWEMIGLELGFRGWVLIFYATFLHCHGSDQKHWQLQRMLLRTMLILRCGLSQVRRECSRGLRHRTVPPKIPPSHEPLFETRAITRRHRITKKNLYIGW